MNQQCPVKIAGIGRYLPPRVVPSSEIERRCELPSGWVERKSGVKERRWVDKETASFMAAEAAKEAISDAGLGLGDIDLIVNASGTQQQPIPDGASLLQLELGLGSSGIPCFSVHATCLGFLVGLDLCGSLLQTHSYRNILLFASDIASCGINYKEPESASLFGDAAAAVVLTRTPEGEKSVISASRLETFAQGAHLTEIRGGGTGLHPSLAQPEDLLFHMDGPAVFMLAIHLAKPCLEKLQPGLTKGDADIDVVIPHQPSLLGVRALHKYCGLPRDKIMLTLDWLGNCVAASIPVTLYEAVHRGRLRRGDKALLLGTGAGLSLCAMILTY